MKDEKLRVAVIGAGKMGLLHASILNVIPDVELVALIDKSPFIRKFCGKLFDKINVVDDIAKLAKLSFNTVYVTTPIPSHYSIIKEINSSGVPANFFVEKTLASNYKDAAELCSIARNSKCGNMVGYMKRFAVTFQKAKELLNQDFIGSVSSFEAHAYSSDFFGVAEISKMSSSRGGVLSDLGSHVIDLALWFFNDFQVQPIEMKDVADIQNSVRFTVKSGDSIEGAFDVSWCKEGYHVPEFGLQVKGSKGKIEVDDDVVKVEKSSGESFRWYRHDLNDNVGFLLGAPEYFREDDYFVKSVLSGVDAEPSFDNASKVDNIIENVRQRAEKNEH